MIKYYEKFMNEIPLLLKEIEEIKGLSDTKEKEYMEYLDKVIFYRFLYHLLIIYRSIKYIIS